MGLLTALGVGANACCPKVEAPGFFPQLWLAEVCKVDKTNVNCVNPATETFWTFEDIRNLPAGTTPPTGAVALPATQEQYSESVTIPVPIKFTGNEGFHRYDAEIDSIELTSKSEGKVGSLSTVYQLEVTLAGSKAAQRGFAEKILNGCFLVSAKRKGTGGERIMMGSPNGKANITEFSLTTGKKAGDDNHIKLVFSDAGAMPTQTLVAPFTEVN